MAKPRINRTELKDLLDQGKNQAEAARIFGVSEAAVSKAVRRFNLAVAQDVATKHAQQLVTKRESAMDQLMSLIDRCEGELQWIESTVPPANDAGYITWQDQKIKHTAEIRKLIGLMADIRTKLYHNEKVERVLLTILEEIRNESQECQKRIAVRLRQSDIHLKLDS